MKQKKISTAVLLGLGLSLLFTSALPSITMIQPSYAHKISANPTEIRFCDESPIPHAHIPGTNSNSKSSGGSPGRIDKCLGLHPQITINIEGKGFETKLQVIEIHDYFNQSDNVSKRQEIVFAYHPFYEMFKQKSETSYQKLGTVVPSKTFELNDACSQEHSLRIVCNNTPFPKEVMIKDIGNNTFELYQIYDSHVDKHTLEYNYKSDNLVRSYEHIPIKEWNKNNLKLDESDSSNESVNNNSNKLVGEHIPKIDTTGLKIDIDINNQQQEVKVKHNYNNGLLISETRYVFDVNTSKFWRIDQSAKYKPILEENGVKRTSDQEITQIVTFDVPIIDASNSVSIRTDEGDRVIVTLIVNESNHDTEEWIYKFNPSTGELEFVGKKGQNTSWPFNIWTQNMILFPTWTHGFPGIHNSRDDNLERLGLMMPHVDKFDIVALQEVFQGTAVNRITKHASNNQYQIFEGSSGKFGQISSGLLMLTNNEHRSELIHREVFDDCGGFIECMSEKGFMVNRIQVGDNSGNYVYLVNTHLNAKDNNVRIKQLQQINNYLDTLVDVPEHPVLFVGDFNIDENRDKSTYKKMLDMLEAEDLYRKYWDGVEKPRLEGVTSDHKKNAYARNWGGENDFSQKRLDYMLVRQGTQYHIEVDPSATFSKEKLPKFQPIDVWSTPNKPVWDSKYMTKLCKHHDEKKFKTTGWIHQDRSLKCYWSDHWGLVAGLKLVMTTEYKKEVTGLSIETTRNVDDQKKQILTVIESTDVFLECENGNHLNKIGNYRDAEECFKKMLFVNPSNNEARIGLAVSFAGSGELERALSEVNRVLEKESDNTLAINAKAMIIYKQEKFSESKNLYENVLLEDPKNEDAHVGIGNIYRITNDVVNATYHYGLADMYSDGTNVDAKNGFALMHTIIFEQNKSKDMIGELETAISFSNESILLDKNSVDGYNGKAFALVKKGTILDKPELCKEAINTFEQALEIFSENQDALHGKKQAVKCSNEK